MGYRTPNIDRIANEGMRFTDSYGEQSCTAGRAAFITGQSVFRTGLSKVGLPGADRPPGRGSTIPELLKPLGYATGQFGKNHLGEKDEFLPTMHGFDEFFGNLYHLNAEEEPELPDWPTGGGLPELPRDGPRGVIHSWAIGRAHDTRRPSWGRWEAADRGHRPTDEEADGDGRRRAWRRRRISSAARSMPRHRSSSGSTRPTCISAPTPNRRASVRPGAGSPHTTTP